MSPDRPKLPAWCWVLLVATLAFDIWYRLYTVSPAIKQAYGINLWTTVKGDSEPLDCDEAVYAYMGKRMVAGDMLYRDLTENKPPLGYWIYGLAVKLGGPTEWAIRLMPIPMVLTTIVLVWWIGLRVGGPGAATFASFAYVLLSTDPYLFGNGANLEHMMNVFSVGSLAAFLVAMKPGGSRTAWVVAGALVGAASLVKQTSAIFLPIYGLLAMAGRDEQANTSFRSRLLNILALGSGFAAAWLSAMAVLLSQGALADGVRDFVGYALALARDTPPEPGQPSRLVRWITGNADPRGILPPPFGKTDYLVWWGTGSWPLWVATVPGLFWMFASVENVQARRAVALWTLAAWVEVGGSGLFWQHYYLLPTPGVALATGFLFGASRSLVRSDGRTSRILSWIGVSFASLALMGTCGLQARDYLGVSPEEITSRFKGGRQWVVLRGLGREIGRRSRVFERPSLYVWGWQSPLYFYSGLDGVTRQNFVDPLMKAWAPVLPDQMPPSVAATIVPRIERTTRDLHREKPPLIFVADRPFPALRALLDDEYLPSRLVPQSPDGQGLWVRRDDYGKFETFELRAER